MNKILVLLMGISLFALTSCEKKYETAGMSTITFYPEFVYSGDEEVFVELNAAFSDPGVVATENGSPIEVATSVEGVFTGYSGNSLNTASADKYLITYTATNSDGFAGNQYRTVWVYEDEPLTSGIAGLYYGTVGRPTTATAQYTDMGYVLIYKIGTNKYGISDALGGYYSIGRAYGDGYAFQGMEITVNNLAANDVTATTAVAPSWGNIADLSDFSVDAANGEIRFKATTDFATNNMFSVKLTKVSF